MQVRRQAAAGGALRGGLAAPTACRKRHVAALASWGWLHTLRTPEKAPGCSAHSGRAAPCRSVHGRLGCGHVAAVQRPLPPPPGTACPLPTAPSTLSLVASRPRLGMSSAGCSGLAVGRPTPLHLGASLHRRTAAPLHVSIAQHASAQPRTLFRRDYCRARRRDPSARAARARERRRDLGGA